ncbi:MAG TPA: GDP-mannose 4,6-dehydratase [Gaiellaceae bacterium]|nr:GDP-mannose 4,6-dehydratase [Gaiellaceae bacterium]
MGVRAGAPLRALVTGAGGQDGSYLVEQLRDEGCDVVGVERGDVDLLDRSAVTALLRDAAPDEVYNLASPSFVPRSWEEPEETMLLGSVGVVALLESIRAVDASIRLVHASSADVFGVPRETPQRETTPFAPQSPYGAAKAAGTFLVAAYRVRYGLHAGSAILFNHESPRRPAAFLPAKVAHGVAAVAAGREHELVLGDLDARRDWGYAPDYVAALRLMARSERPDDYVVATGELHSVRELVELAFAHAGLDWRAHVRVDESLKRGDTFALVGDATKARDELGWRSTVRFDELVRLLVDEAMRA